MNYLKIGVLLLLPLVCFAKGKRNIDTTPTQGVEDTLVLQTENDFYHIQGAQDVNGNHLGANTQYNTVTLEYASKSGLSVQLANYNCPWYGGGAQNLECDAYVNLSQTIKLAQHWSAMLGSQNGTVFAGPSQWHNADYGLIVYNIDKVINLHAGPYFADKTLALTTNVVGYTYGFSVSYSANIRIEADYFSGHYNVSGANVNFFYGEYFAGIIVPEHNSGNEFAGVLGVRKDLSSFLKIFK